MMMAARIQFITSQLWNIVIFCTMLLSASLCLFFRFDLFSTTIYTPYTEHTHTLSLFSQRSNCIQCARRFVNGKSFQSFMALNLFAHKEIDSMQNGVLRCCLVLSMRFFSLSYLYRLLGHAMYAVKYDMFIIQQTAIMLMPNIDNRIC